MKVLFPSGQLWCQQGVTVRTFRANYSYACGPTYRKCPGFYCIPWQYVCNHRIDCPGGLDERLCDRQQCTYGAQFRCRNSATCVALQNVCDGVDDCPLQDDEYFCETYPRKCPLYCICLLWESRHLCSNKHFKCPGFYCIPWRFVCNGRWECPGGVDENICDLVGCPGMFKCQNSSVCVSRSNICDGFNDCILADDEHFCSLLESSTLCPSNCSCKIFEKQIGAFLIQMPI